MQQFLNIIPNRNCDSFLKKIPKTVKIYCVGGAVRDTLLKRQTTSDKDFLLVGTNYEEILSIGFIPVGKKFPVFIHPTTKEEYALARTEQKEGVGHGGFLFNSSRDISLKDDLGRRDFTINAMAVDEQGNLHDYFSGRDDLSQKVLKHIGPSFSEDPLRLFRLARFLSTHPEFTVHFKTIRLCEKIVHSKEILALSKDRIWK